MDTQSTLIASNPIKPSCFSFQTIYSTILCITTFSSLILLRYSPLVIWITANAIIFSVYKFSSSRFANNSDTQPDLVHPIITFASSYTWHDHYPSAIGESEPTEKEVTCVETVGETDKKVTKKESTDGVTWNEIKMQSSGTVEKKPSLKKSGTWERSRRRLQRADEVRLKRELKKSATYKDIGRDQELASHNQHVEEKTSKGDTGWRTREVLVVPQDDLFRRIENFIKKQHESLRRQRQESDCNHFLDYSTNN